MSRNVARLSTLAVLLSGVSVFAQPGPERGGFRNNLPEAGSPLPELTLYDEAGEPFSTRALGGTHSVLVFGCLT